MQKTFRDVEAAHRWLKRPVPGLHDRTPEHVILDGGAEKLTGMLLALNTGMSLEWHRPLMRGPPTRSSGTAGRSIAPAGAFMVHER